MSYQKNRNGKTLMTKFKLLAVALAVLGLGLASMTLIPPVAQAAAANCGGSANPLHGRSQEVVDTILTKLSVSNCRDVTAAQLAGITGELDLSLQSINTLRKGDFDNLTSLQTINLKSNWLPSLHKDLFDGLTSLEKIDLEDNLLDSVDEDLFDGLTSLQEIDLSDNVVPSLPADLFDGLTNLQVLRLDRNSLTALPEDVFDGLTNLRELHLDENSLAALPEDVFDGLTKLDRLNLHKNSFTALPSDVFDGLDSLEHLLLGENSLAAVPSDVFDGLSNLQRLFLDNNPLVWLPPDLFAGLSSLQELRLNSHNTNFDTDESLACIHAGQFDGLSELQELRLGLHQLGNIDPSHFARWNLGKLEELRLGGTAITNSPLAAQFADYQAVLPALVKDTTRVENTADLTDPICGSINRDAGTGVVRVLLEKDSVRPNRARVSDAASLGDGDCGSDATETRHQLWTWQRSADGIAWTDLPAGRQPKDYGARVAGECSFLFTPQTGDNNMYVRAYVPVNTTGLGENNYHSAAFGPLDVQ